MMATSSFDKDFTLKSQKAVDSFFKIISSANEKKGIKIDRTFITEETKKRGEEKLKKMLSR